MPLSYFRPILLGGAGFQCFSPHPQLLAAKTQSWESLPKRWVSLVCQLPLVGRRFQVLPGHSTLGMLRSHTLTCTAMVLCQERWAEMA